jgi:hypothetical protein
MKKIILFVSATILLVIVLIVTIFFKTPTVTFQLSDPIGSNMRFATQAGPSQINYFNGSIFITKSLVSGESKALSPVFTLPTVTEVKWGTNGVAFKAGNYSGVDQLNKLLISAGLSTNKTYWWICDFKTGALSIVGSNLGSLNNVFTPADDVVWDTDSQSYTFLITAYPKSGPEQIIIKQSIGSSPVQISRIPKNNSLVSANSKVIDLIANADQSTLQAFEVSSKKFTKLITSYGINAKTSADGTSSTFITSTEAVSEGSGFVTGDLKAISPESDKPKLISHNVTGSIAWDKSSEWLELGPSKNKLSGYKKDSDNKLSNVQINTRKLNIDANTMTLMSYQNGIALLLAADNTAYLASVNLISVSNLSKDTSSVQKPIYTADFYSSYDDQKKQYTVYILKNPYQAGIAKSISYYQQLGVDPFQLNMKWYPYDGVTIN